MTRKGLEIMTRKKERTRNMTDDKWTRLRNDLQQKINPLFIKPAVHCIKSS